MKVENITIQRSLKRNKNRKYSEWSIPGLLDSSIVPDMVHQITFLHKSIFSIYMVLWCVCALPF